MGQQIGQQARQESNLQPPVLEPTPSNAGVAAFVDFQGLSSEPTTPALLDNAGVGTNPGTNDGQGRAERVTAPVPQDMPPAFADNQAVAILGRKGVSVKYKIALQKTDEGYAVSVPGLPGCWSQGATESEALSNIRDAIREYLAAREGLLKGAVVREVDVAS